jgi:hypothetical protein
MEENSSIVPAEAKEFLPAVSDFKYIEGERADFLRERVAALRLKLKNHNRQKLEIGAALLELETELKGDKRFMHWCMVHFSAPDAPYKCSYETLRNYMNLVKYSTGNPEIPDKIKYEAYRNNPDPYRVSVAQSFEERGQLTIEVARTVRRAPRQVVQRLSAGTVDIPTAHEFTEQYVRASKPVQQVIEASGTHQPVTVYELQRAYIEEGQGKTTRFSEVVRDGSLNFMNGERVLLGDATPLHWDKFLKERQSKHIDDHNLIKYDWHVDQVGELYLAPAKEGIVFSDDEDTLVFVIKHPPPDLVRKAGRKGKIRIGLEVQATSGS